MLRKYVRILPYLLVALFITSIFTILEGEVARRMMRLLDDTVNGKLNAMKQSIPVLLILATLLLPLSILVAVTNNFYKRKANTSLKKYYITKVFGKNIAEFQKENNARYLSSLTNDFETLDNNLITGIYAVCSGVVSFFVGIWLVSTVDTGLVFLSLGIIAAFMVISTLTSKPTKKAYKERSDLFDGYTSYIKEILSAFHIVKNYNLQDTVREDYYRKSSEIQHKYYLIEKLFTKILCIENLFMNGAIFGVVGGVGYLAVMGKATPGGLLLIIEGIQRVTNPLYTIGENLPKLFTSGDLIRKMEKTLENTDTFVETVDLPEFTREIEFRNVEFQYEDSEQLILKDINLCIKKNGKYLIVGPSGGGKSTLLKLFRKVYHPTGGSILIDGFDLRAVKKDQYYQLVANIEQQVFIFEDTIRNNITLYKEYPEQELQAALEASGLTEFVEQKPEGLNTMVYDNGKNISGGERSRIVIARALLNKASILFMDEAFASLDMERAREIEKTILRLKDITVINVSHVIFKETRELYDRVITVKGTIY